MTSTISPITTPAGPAGPTGPARSTESPRYLLPAEAYTSQAWFDREQRELFPDVWYFAGMSSDVPETGDYLSVQVGAVPIVVVRQPTGELAAFHNICRHRGAVLLEGTGNVRHGIRCFYHSWTYGLDGALRRVPQPEQFPSLDKGELGLHPASVAVWNGLIFVHADPTAEDLVEDWLGDLVPLLGPYDPSRLVQLTRMRQVMNANWKLFIENHIDGYHLWHLHARTIKGLDHAKQEYQHIGRHWTFYEPTSRPGVSPDEQGTGLPVIDHVGEHWYGSAVHMVFPNLGIASMATFWLTIQAIPVAPDKTILETRFWTMPVSRLAVMARFAAGETLVRIRNATRHLDPRSGTDGGAPKVAGFNDLVAEDIHAAESLQRALASPSFSVGPMAKDYERAITEYQTDLLDYLPPHGP